MYKCPYCNSDIKKGAVKCPNCENEIGWMPVKPNVSNVLIRSKIQSQPGVSKDKVFEKLFTQMFEAVKKAWKVTTKSNYGSVEYEATLDVIMESGSQKISTTPVRQVVTPVSTPVVRQQQVQQYAPPQRQYVQQTPQYSDYVPRQQVVSRDYQQSMPVEVSQQKPINAYDEYVINTLKAEQGSIPQKRPTDEFLAFKQNLQQNTMQVPKMNYGNDGFEMDMF